MIRCMLAFGLLLCCLPVSAQKTQNMKTFASAEGQFWVLLPAAPNVKLHEPGKDGVEGRMEFTVDRGEYGYYINVESKSEIHAAGRADESVLNTMRDILVKVSDGKLLSERALQRNEYRGRELAISLDAGKSMRCIVMVVGSRVYTVTFLGPKSMVNNTDTSAYLASFLPLVPRSLPDTWQRYSVCNGLLSVKLPGKPIFGADHKGTEDETDVWQFDDPDTKVEYLISSSVIPPKVLKSVGSDTFLDKTRDVLLKGFDARLITERLLSVGGYPGRELMMHLIQNGAAVGSAVVRLVIINGQIINVTLLGPYAGMQKVHVYDFMESCQIEKRK